MGEVGVGGGRCDEAGVRGEVGVGERWRRRRWGWGAGVVNEVREEVSNMPAATDSPGMDPVKSTYQIVSHTYLNSWA